MIEAEAQLLKTMADELASPEPTPEEVIQELRDNGRHLEAEALEHNQKTVLLRAEAEEAEMALAEAKEQTESHARNSKVKRCEEALQKAREKYDEHRTTGAPYQQRENRRKQLEKESVVVDKAAESMLTFGTSESLSRGETMKREALQMRSEAEKLGRINRGAEPPPAA